MGVKVVTNLSNNLILKNIHQVQDLMMNLMLAGDLNEKGYASKFTKGTWELFKGDLVVVRGEGIATSIGQLWEVSRVVWLLLLMVLL